VELEQQDWLLPQTSKGGTMVNLAEQTVITLLSTAIGVGIVFGMVKGTFMEYKKNTDEHLTRHDEQISHLVCEGRCSDRQTSCRHEVLSSLNDLKTGQAQILDYLLNGPGKKS